MSDSARKENNCLRSNSICSAPESDLLNYVRENDVEKVSRLIKNNKKILNHIYPSEYNRSILLIALKERAETETIETLIKLGADLDYSSKIDGHWQALHFAAASTRSDVLKIVLDHLKSQEDINATAKGNTALHVLIKRGKSDLSEEFEKCAKLLLHKGINVNLTDKKGMTPIMWAANEGYKHLIKVVLEESRMPVDLDISDSEGRSARDIIISDDLYDGPLPEASGNNTEPIERRLFQLLKTGRENDFVEVNLNNIKFVNGKNVSTLSDTTTNLTLLQTSCTEKLPKAVKHLLKSGADPNVSTTSGDAPIEIAAKKGRWDIFQVLLDHISPVPNSILTTLLKRIDYDQFPEDSISHEKCYEILLEKLKTNEDLLDLNAPDKSGNYPLHYAVQYAEPEKVKELLELGASLGSKNQFGVMPVQDIEPLVLEKHLDDCVKFELSKKIDKEFLVTFDYRTLIPSSNTSEINGNSDNNDLEMNLTRNDKTKHELVAETEVIAYMSESAEFKYLLTHPVIVSFLFLKWQRISLLFYVNLIFYILFSCALVTYIFASYTNPNTSDMTPFVTFLAYTSKAILCLTFLILVFRELFQMAISPSAYFKNFENYLEIILIFCTGSILCNANVLPGEENSIDDTKKILSALSILLAAFELVLMVGQHPKLSTNVVMLRTVSLNFFKFFLWYSLLIIAFALSFYILFSETKPMSKNETTDAQAGEDQFADPGKSVFKTIVMLTGEFDASSMNFNRFPITSKIMFSLFIFMIAIILLNLLNGLAVSDTHMIKSNAELVGHITRAQHIRYVESMILGNVLPSKLIRTLRNMCCYCPNSGSYTFSIFQSLAQRVCLFPNFLENYKLSIYPNEGGKIKLPNGRTNAKTGSQRDISHCYSCNNLYLDKDTIKRANIIVQKRRESMKRKQEGTSLQKIYDKISMLENRIKKLDSYFKDNENEQK